MNSQPILVPLIIPHNQGVPNMDKVFNLIALHSEVIYTQGMSFTYKILMGESQIKIIFSIKKKEIR